MSPETTGTVQAHRHSGTTVVFTRGTDRHQIWASQTTGRIVEVQQNASWLPTALLEPGDLGELHYQGARPIIARIAVQAAPPRDPDDARAWVRVALADLGTAAHHDALEAAAVLPMRTANPDPAAVRESSLAIAVLCASLERHRHTLR